MKLTTIQFILWGYLFSTFSSVTFAADATSSADKPTLSISSNPGSVNYVPGTGALQRYINKQLGIKNTHGFYFDGVWVGDTNELFSGGIPNPQRVTSNSLLILNLNVNTNDFIGWKNGLFGTQFLQFNGQPTNFEAGSVQGYNSLPGPPPLKRTELYQLWFRQTLLDDNLIVRVGKLVPTYDFNNVVAPVQLHRTNDIPAVTGLISTPVYVNPSMLGVIPGYYNSAYGVTLNFVPSKNWYVSGGRYDGTLAQGIQTGLTGPHFNGSYFNIAETGINWQITKNKLPGKFAIGGWHQTGLITGFPNLTENGASGFYIFGSQRLWYKNPNIDDSGISAFYQYGKNNSNTLPMTEYVGGGVTAFGLVPKRKADSMGAGITYAWLNQNSFVRKDEIMYQAYYQANIVGSIFVEGALTYIPAPGALPNINADWAGTLRAIVLF